MTLNLPNTVPEIAIRLAMQPLLQQFSLVLVPDGRGNYSAITSGEQRARQAKAERETAA